MRTRLRHATSVFVHAQRKKETFHIIKSSFFFIYRDGVFYYKFQIGKRYLKKNKSCGFLKDIYSTLK